MAEKIVRTKKGVPPLRSDSELLAIADKKRQGYIDRCAADIQHKAAKEERNKRLAAGEKLSEIELIQHHCDWLMGSCISDDEKQKSGRDYFLEEAKIQGDYAESRQNRGGTAMRRLQSMEAAMQAHIYALASDDVGAIAKYRQLEEDMRAAVSASDVAEVVEAVIEYSESCCRSVIKGYTGHLYGTAAMKCDKIARTLLTLSDDALLFNALSIYKWAYLNEVATTNTCEDSLLSAADEPPELRDCATTEEKNDV